MTISFYPDLESLSRAAAELFVRQARHVVHAHGQFFVAISGGQTPRRTYELLAHQPFRDAIPWGKVHVFWGDERCVTPDDPRSNERMARHALLDHVPIPPAQIHPIYCSQAPQETAKQYETLLRTFFARRRVCFDLILLGLGENGHTASLFPEMPVLEERERWVSEVYIAEEDLYRVTLTAPLINRAALVAFLVAGSAKAHILQRVLNGPYTPDSLPAQLIRPSWSDLIWLVDGEAGSLIRD